MLAAASALGACGGGGSAGTDAATATGESAAETPAATLAATTSSVVATPLANASFSLRSVGVQQRAPFCLGYAFQRGDVPKGSTVVRMTSHWVAPRASAPSL